MANNKFTYEISQSITGSTIKSTDTVEFSFQAMTDNTRTKFYSNHTINFLYSGSDGDNYTQLPDSDSLKLPKKFVLGTAYSKKSFVFAPPTDVVGIKAVISGSVGKSEGTGTDTSIDVMNAMKIDYDDFKFNVETTKVELTDSGLLIYTSPSRYVRANPSGLDILGGDVNVDKVTANELEIYGDVSVFGDLQASSIPADEVASSLIADISTSNAPGDSAKYARADHIHDLPFSVLDDVVQEGYFTQISSSKISGSQMHIEGNAFISGTLEVIDLITRTITASTVEFTGSNIFGDSASEDIHYFTGSIEASGAYHSLFGTNVTMSAYDTVKLQDVVYVTSSKVGIGTTTPENILDISGSTKVFGEMNTHLFVSGSGSANIILRASASTAYETYGMSSTGNKFKINRLNNAGTSTTSTPFTIDGDKVGIGTTSPSKELTVAGNISASGDLYLGGGDVRTLDGTNLYLRPEGHGRVYIGANGDGADLYHWTGSGVYSYFDFSGDYYRITTTATSGIRLYNDTTITGNLTASGNISSSGNIYVTQITASSGIKADSFQSVTGGTAIDFNDDIDLTGNFTASGDISQSATSTGSFGSLYDSGQAYFGGNVGIGTTSPSSLLHVQGTLVAVADQPGILGLFEQSTDGRTLFRVRNTLANVSAAATATGISLVAYSNVSNNPISNTIEAQLLLRQEGTSTNSNGETILIAPNDILFNVNANDLVMTGSSYNNVGTNAMYITGSTGNVGIGTTSPTVALQVEGDISASGVVYARRFESSGSADSIDIVDSIDVTGNITASGDISQSATSTGSFGMGYFDGNVGIGTTSPGHTLEVKGSESTLARFYDSSNGSIGQIEIGTMDIKVNNNEMQFRDAADTPILTITDDEYVGIGNSNPPERLTVEGNISASGDLILNDGTTSLIYDASTHELISDGATFAIKGTDINFDNDTLYIDESENSVGIGTDDPTYNLDVVGDIGVNEYIYHNDDSGTYIRFENDSFKIGTGGSVGIRQDSAGRIGIGRTPAFTLDVDGDGAFKESVGTSSFASGFAGHGWRISNTGDAGATGSDGWGMSIDNLTVRGQMKVYELLIQQLRATNGSVWISSTGKVDTVTALATPSFSLQFDTGSNTYGHGFREGDLIRAQKFQGAGSEDVVMRSDLVVVSIGNSGSLTAVTSSTGNTPPSGGFDYVRIGNTTSASRQGAVYLTSDDDEAPYIDIIDGVSAHADFNADNNIKARLGKLDGISDTNYGDLSTGSNGTIGNNYGLYSDNVYLKGGIRASFGEIGGFGIGTTVLSSSDNSFILSSSDVSMKLGATANQMTFTNDAGIFMSGSGDFRVGHPTDDNIGQLKFTAGTGLELTASYINLKGSGVEIETENFELNSSGLDISAFSRSIDLGDGKIILSGSTVPVIKIDGGEISASNFFVSSTGEMTASAGQIANWVIGADKLYNTSMALDNTNERILLGSNSSYNSAKIAFSGSGEGFVANQSMSWDSSGNLQLTASKVDISGSDVNILTPNFFFGSATSHISGSSTGLIMSSSEFRLDTADLDIDSVGKRINLGEGAIILDAAGTNESYIELNSQIKLFTDGNNTEFYTTTKNTFTDTDAGFYLASGSSGVKVNIGDNTSAIKFDSADSSFQITSSNVDISGSDVNISSPSIFLGQGNSNFISASSGKIEISSSNFHLKEGNITASNVDLSGKITATSGEFTGDVIATHINTTSGSIGGWTIGTDKLSTTGFQLSSSGYVISSSNFQVDHSGNITASNVDISGNITITGGQAQTDIENLQTATGSLEAADDILQGNIDTVQGNAEDENRYNTWVINPDFNATSSTSPVKGWGRTSTGANPSEFTPTATDYISIIEGIGDMGGNVIELTGSNNSLYATNPIPVDTSHVYRLSFRARETKVATNGDTAGIYCGFVCMDEDFVNIDEMDATHRYFVKSNYAFLTLNEWEVHSATITGEGPVTNKFKTGTKYIRPLILYNWEDSNATTQLDWVKVENLTVGETNDLTTPVSPGGLIDMAETPDGAGLYLGANNLGYYNSSWKTYMSSSGDFYLTGSDGFLQWDSSDSALSLGGSKVELKLGSDISTFTNSAIALSGSGEGHLAGGGVSWNKDGNLTVSGTISSSEGNIGGWTIGSTSFNKNLIELNATSQSLIVKDSFDNEKIRVGSGSLSDLSGVSTNILLNNGFELDSGGATSLTNWKLTHNAAGNELWNSGSIVVAVSESAASASSGTKFLEIFVGKQTGGDAAAAEGDSGG